MSQINCFEFVNAGKRGDISMSMCSFHRNIEPFPSQNIRRSIKTAFDTKVNKKKQRQQHKIRQKYINKWKNVHIFVGLVSISPR